MITATFSHAIGSNVHRRHKLKALFEGIVPNQSVGQPLSSLLVCREAAVLCRDACPGRQRNCTCLLSEPSLFPAICEIVQTEHFPYLYFSISSRYANNWIRAHGGVITLSAPLLTSLSAVSFPLIVNLHVPGSQSSLICLRN